MLDATIDHLAERGFIRGEKVWTAGIVEQLRAILLDRPVGSTDAQEVQEKARTKTDLRLAVLGSSDEDEVDGELDALVGRLLTVGPKGPVQRSFENGYVLCPASLMRQVIEGEPPIKVRGARFATDRADVVETFLETSVREALVRKAASYNEILEMTGRRIPALATRRPVLARRSQEQLALAIPLEATAA